MHNGQIGGFERIRRALENAIADDLYDQRQGTTDFELFFLLMLDEGLRRSAGARCAPPRGSSRRRGRAGIEPSLKLTAAFSDGETLYAVRYATDGNAPTLYTAETRHDAGRCIVSEPYDREGGDWHAIPPASFVTITKGSMTIRPFAPEAPKLARIA